MVRSTSLGIVKLTVATFHTLYTVPAGRRTIVKSVAIYNGGAAGRTAYVAVVRGGTTFYGAVWTLGASQANPSSEQEVWWVLNTGDQLKVQTIDSGDMSFIVSGAELII